MLSIGSYAAYCLKNGLIVNDADKTQDGLTETDLLRS